MLSEVGFDNFIELPLPHKKELLEIFKGEKELIVFDIGACEAEDSIRYIKLFPGSHVHAFEPVQSNYKIASNNIKKYKLQNSITLNQCALSDKNGTADFFLSSGTPTDITPEPNWDYGNKSSSLLQPEKTLEVVPWLKFNKKTTIKTMTLDSYCKKHKIPKIHVVHMDVQGAELMVLKGAGDMLSRIEAIWMEVEAVELYKGQPLKNDVEKFMKKAGFVKYLDTVNEVAGDQLYIRKKIRPGPFKRIKDKYIARN